MAERYVPLADLQRMLGDTARAVADLDRLDEADQAGSGGESRQQRRERERAQRKGQASA